MIQPASYFSSIAPVATFSGAPGPMRPKFRAEPPILERIEQPKSRPASESDNHNPQAPEQTPQARDFIDTILTDGQFLPLTDPEPQAFNQGTSSNGNRDTPANHAPLGTEPALTPADLSAVRAAAQAWHKAAPNRLDSADLPPSIATYLTVQTGGTPALGLSLFA
ncbi:hypothetical protein [Gilvimarinus agarilyticus]|uniref:hypothetical protein n=1 Tax=Gilvimarinus agarilyticus TaxID=679259 RepID=UPI0005A00B29|nr:hypothetical protein [Gilvimarinus agarilyticus]